MMTTKDQLAELLPSPNIYTIRLTEWKQILEKIDEALAIFIVQAESQSIPLDVPYISEWITMYDDVKSMIEENPTMTFKAVAEEKLFGDPETLMDFGHEMLRNVPIIRPLFCIKRAKKRGEINLHVNTMNEELFKKMKDIHFKYVPTDNDQDTENIEEEQSNLASIFETDKIEETRGGNDNSLSLTSSIQEQVRDMEAKMDIATKYIRDKMLGSTTTLKQECKTSRPQGINYREH